MKRCKARDPSNTQWRCTRPEHTGIDHEYRFVSRIRLPKSQMELLHALAARLKTVECALLNPEWRMQDVAASAQTRDALIDQIHELYVFGRERFVEHDIWVNAELHRGHQSCFRSEDGTTCLTPKPRDE